MAVGAGGSARPVRHCVCCATPPVLLLPVLLLPVLLLPVAWRVIRPQRRRLLPAAPRSAPLPGAVRPAAAPPRAAYCIVMWLRCAARRRHHPSHYRRRRMSSPRIRCRSRGFGVPTCDHPQQGVTDSHVALRRRVLFCMWSAVSAAPGISAAGLCQQLPLLCTSSCDEFLTELLTLGVVVRQYGAGSSRQCSLLSVPSTAAPAGFVYFPSATTLPPRCLLDAVPL